MKQDERLKLDNQLCFTIYACSREITGLYRPYLEKLGLTYPQYLALLVLWESEPCTVKQLGERLYLDSGTLTPMLKRMESLGLVERHRSQLDERQVNIRLTEKGRLLKEEAACVPEALFANSGLSEEGFMETLTSFRQLLGRIHQSNN